MSNIIIFFALIFSFKSYSIDLKRFTVKKTRPYSVQKVRSPHPVRSGNKSLRFELRKGDCFKNEFMNDCLGYRERVELKELWRAPHRMSLWYQFSFFMPKDYKDISIKQIFGQWHDSFEPIVSNRYKNGKFWIDIISKVGQTTHKYVLNKDEFSKGKWIDFKYNIRWDQKNGFVKVYVNNKFVYEYNGKTLLSKRSKWPAFHFGIYRSHIFRLEDIDEDRTQYVYYDCYKRAFTEEELDKKLCNEY